MNLVNVTSAFANYSQTTANTGLGTISTGNSALDGSGALVQILTAALNGTTIKSIIIKATGNTGQGMVRLFIKNASNTVTTLIREIQIPQTTQTSVAQAYSIVLTGEYNLPQDYTLHASTQLSDSFNVIVESLDWNYQANLPPSCADFSQNTANLGNAKISTANSSLQGSGTIVSVFQAGGNGSSIQSITVKATGSTTEGMVRLFIKNNSGGGWVLFKEVSIPAITQTAVIPAFDISFKSSFDIESGFEIGASTQNAENFNVIIEALDWTFPTF